MSLFDSLTSAVSGAVGRELKKTVNSAERKISADISKKLNTKKETFKFETLPTSVEDLSKLPEFKLDTPYKTAALVLAVLCNYESNPEETFAMLDSLKGPESVSTYEKQFIRERLTGRQYVITSFFEGATDDNGYKPTTPFSITVSSNSYSFTEENWATLFVTSAGADSERMIKLRKKPSTGQWFLNEVQCLGDIKTPKALDPWA